MCVHLLCRRSSSRTSMPDWCIDEQRKPGHVQLRHSEITAAAAGYQGTDHVSCVFGPSQEHDLPLRTRHMPDVWWPHVWVSHLSQAGWEAHSLVLRSVCVEDSVRQVGCVPHLKYTHIASTLQSASLFNMTGKGSSLVLVTHNYIWEEYEWNLLSVCITMSSTSYSLLIFLLMFCHFVCEEGTWNY
jgi:hypothetical protein